MFVCTNLVARDWRRLVAFYAARARRRGLFFLKGLRKILIAPKRR